MEVATETQQLIQFGQIAWIYLIENSHILIDGGVFKLCSIPPGEEFQVCAELPVQTKGGVKF